jgi:hypothetical protein
VVEEVRRPLPPESQRHSQPFLTAAGPLSFVPSCVRSCDCSGGRLLVESLRLGVPTMLGWRGAGRVAAARAPKAFPRMVKVFFF